MTLDDIGSLLMEQNALLRAQLGRLLEIRDRLPKPQTSIVTPALEVADRPEGT